MRVPRSAAAACGAQPRPWRLRELHEACGARAARCAARGRGVRERAAAVCVRSSARRSELAKAYMLELHGAQLGDEACGRRSAGAPESSGGVQRRCAFGVRRGVRR